MHSAPETSSYVLHNLISAVLFSRIPKTIGVSMPMKATFFITYIMVDGWAGVAAEVLRVVPLVIFHLKNTFLVKTEKDREQAMDPGFLDFAIYEPRIQLYFLLGLVYCAVTPILLPFIIVFFAFAYLVFRHQVWSLPIAKSVHNTHWHVKHVCYAFAIIWFGVQIFRLFICLTILEFNVNYHCGFQI